MTTMGFGADPAAMIFDRLLDDRIVLLTSAVTDEVAARVTAGLLLLAGRDGDRDITLHVNCPGGDPSAGLAVLDTMNFVSCDVSTVAMGTAGGIGQILLSGGARGKRYALPHARIVMRQPDGEQAEGRASDIAIRAEQVLALKRRLAELNAEFTGHPVERIEADSDRDRWFTAAEAKDYGLVDAVVLTNKTP
jgi:ATP-dependent Clp protease protease subunit